MSDYIDTREGWREIHVEDPDQSVYQLAEYDRETGALVHAWVRVCPVPPLPTAPYTVIRVTWPKDLDYPDVWCLMPAPPGMEAHVWRALTIDGGVMTDGMIKVTSFEVLSEPRAVTAKAVLDLAGPEGLVSVNLIAHEFAVSDE